MSDLGQVICYKYQALYNYQSCLSSLFKANVSASGVRIENQGQVMERHIRFKFGKIKGEVESIRINRNL